MKTFKDLKSLLSKKPYDRNDVLDHKNAVTYTHPKNGYSVTITPKKPGTLLRHHNDEEGDDGPARSRQGIKTLTSPTGEKLTHHFWMNVPEDNWTHNGVNLNKDHYKPRLFGKSVWSKLPLETRLNAEVKQQAHAYDPLPKQFAETKSHLLATGGQDDVQ